MIHRSKDWLKNDAEYCCDQGPHENAVTFPFVSQEKFL